jgi:hypothetical protein
MSINMQNTEAYNLPPEDWTGQRRTFVPLSDTLGKRQAIVTDFGVKNQVPWPTPPGYRPMAAVERKGFWLQWEDKTWSMITRGAEANADIQILEVDEAPAPDAPCLYLVVRPKGVRVLHSNIQAVMGFKYAGDVALAQGRVGNFVQWSNNLCSELQVDGTQALIPLKWTPEARARAAISENSQSFDPKLPLDRHIGRKISLLMVGDREGEVASDYILKDIYKLNEVTMLVLACLPHPRLPNTDYTRIFHVPLSKIIRFCMNPTSTS